MLFFEDIPVLFERSISAESKYLKYCTWLCRSSGFEHTDHDPNVPFVNTVAPWNIKYDLRCSIDIWLDEIGVHILSEARFAKVAKHCTPGFFRPLQPSRLVYDPITIDLARSWVTKLDCFEILEGLIIFDSQLYISCLQIW